MSLLIKNAKIYDPGVRDEEGMDLFISDGKIVKIGKNLTLKAKDIFDCSGKIVVPGFLDLHVHFREPGDEHKETILTGSKAALKGGFVGAVSMPNTRPASDSQAIVEFVLKRAREANFNIFPCGTLSKGRDGKEISSMLELKAAGCVAVSDDGSYLRNPLVARHAFEYASQLGLIVMSHAEIPELTQGGVINEGQTSTILGLKGMPAVAEIIAVSQDLELAKMTGARLHISHLSSRGALEKIIQAKKEKFPVTCEVTPHHLTLTEQVLTNYNTNFKMNPPLRSEIDRMAMEEGIINGDIDCIATDHAPHQDEEKDQEFEKAPFGVIGLETAFSVVYTELCKKNGVPLEKIIKALSINPAKILSLSNFNRIAEESAANLSILDLNRKWTVTKEEIISKSKNSCYLNRELQGYVAATVCNGLLYDWEDTTSGVSK